MGHYATEISLAITKITGGVVTVETLLQALQSFPHGQRKVTGGEDSREKDECTAIKHQAMP